MAQTFSPAISAQSPLRFPLALAIAAILLTSLGLAAAALDIKMGAAPPPGDALRSAWSYVNQMLLLVWLLLWPLSVLRPPNTPTHSFSTLFLQWLSLLACSIPALTTSAFLADASAPMIAAMLSLQLGISLLALGALAAATRFRATTPPIFAATCLASLATVAPLMAFLWLNFLPRASTAWFPFIPALAVARAAQPIRTWPEISPSMWHATIAFASIGLFLPLLALLPQSPRRSRLQ